MAYAIYGDPNHCGASCVHCGQSRTLNLSSGRYFRSNMTALRHPSICSRWRLPLVALFHRFLRRARSRHQANVAQASIVLHVRCSSDCGAIARDPIGFRLAPRSLEALAASSLRGHRCGAYRYATSLILLRMACSWACIIDSEGGTRICGWKIDFW